MRSQEQVGQLIGRYKLLEQIGEGGFGVVYLAEQTKPVKRQVALKIVKLGMDTKDVLARFDAERQALAVMDHPNIAKVLDAGATPMGRPYFVMELVDGVSITAYCDRNDLAPKDRLRLFVDCCHAVQHAHQKGIIHRDIKPSNVMITLQDGVPVPKVIDFGIAKATSTKLTEHTLITQMGQFVGTPEYMSPEQVATTGQDIDTRSDVYALGVLLYELLTGTTPFETSALRRAAIGEMQRIIREEEPPRPSTRVAALASQTTQAVTAAPTPGAATVVVTSGSATDGFASDTTLDEIARHRGTNGAALRRLLRGDLDWIIMKALEKDRGRRYESANGLAADVDRYLDGAPVTAAPPSTAYRVKKFVRRNRNLVAAGVLVTTTLVVGLTGTAIGLVWALSEKERAEEAERETAERATELAQVAEFQASQLSEIDVEQMAVHLRDDLLLEVQAERPGSTKADAQDRADRLSELLAETNLTNVAMKTLDRNIFARALLAVEEQFADQPLVRARLLQTMAVTLSDLGLIDAATTPQTQALEIRRSVLGGDHLDTLTSASSMGNLLKAQGKLAEAEPYLRDALAGRRRLLGDEHPNTLTSIHNLGALLKDQGNLAEAELCYDEALAGSRRVLGDDHPDTLKSLGNMGTLLCQQGKLAEAEPYFREVLAVKRRVHGDDHPSTLTAVNNMGTLLVDKRELSEAEAYYREALAGRRRVLGDDHPSTLTAVHNLGSLFCSQGKLAEAEPYLREALAGSRRILGDDHFDTLASVNQMAGLLRAQGKLAEAEPYFREALAGVRRLFGDDSEFTLATTSNLCDVLSALGRFAESEKMLRDALPIYERAHGTDHWAAEARSRLGAALVGLDRHEDAEPLLIAAHAQLDATLSDGRGELRESIERLVALYESWDKPEEAAEWRAKLADDSEAIAEDGQ